MMHKNLKKKLGKITILATTVCFIANSGFAQLPLAVDSPAFSNPGLNAPLVDFARKLSLPVDMGEVSSLYVPSTRNVKEETPFIIHVQDAHAHELAQKKIKDILTHLKNQYGVELFGFEGSHTALAPSVLHVADKAETNLKIANYLVEKGELTGGELFALEQTEKNLAGPNTHFEGIEDLKLYTRDLKLFRMGLKGRDEIAPLMERLSAHVSRMKSKAFSPELLKFDRAYQAFSTRDEKNILLFFNKVRSKAKSLMGIDLVQIQNQRQYPQLVRLAHLADESAKLDPEAIKADIDHLTGELNRINEKSPYLNILAALAEGKKVESKPYATWRETFEGLQGIFKSNKISWDNFPQFKTLAKHLILEEELASVELFEELEALVNQIESKMAKKPIENDLIKIAQDYALYHKVMRLEASRKEVDGQMKQSDSFLVNLNTIYGQVENGNLSFTKEEADQLAKQMTIAKRFYAGARQREQAFVTHLLEFAKKYHTQRIAFVTGGYHTLGIREELERRGIAYASISPRMVSDEDGNLKDHLSHLYEEGMLGSRQTIFDKSHIVKEIMSLTNQSYQELVGSGDFRVKPLLEAIVKVGLEDITLEIPFNSENAITTLALADGLQKKFQGNSILGGNVQVAMVEESAQPAIRISWKQNRAGYEQDARVLEALAKKNLKAQAISKSANSLGLAKKSEGTKKERAFEEGSPDFQMRRWLSFRGIPGVLAGLVALPACSNPLGPRTRGGSPAPSGNQTLDPIPSGTVTGLPKADVIVNQQTGQTEKRALNPIALQKTDTQGTVIKGSTIFLNETGVNVLAMEFNWKLDPNDPLKTFSGGAFTAPQGSSVDLLDPQFDFITIFVKSDIPKLRLEIEDITSTPDKPVKVQIDLDKANTGIGQSGGVFYRIPFKQLVDAFNNGPVKFDRKKIKTIALVVDKNLAGNQNQGTVIWAVGGVNTPPLPIQVRPTPFTAAEISDFSTQDRRPVVTRANGGNPASFVVRQSPSRFVLNSVTAPGSPSAGISNEFSGALLFSQDFQTPEDKFDFLNSNKLTPPDKLRFNIAASSTTNLPDVKVVVVGRDGLNNKLRQEFLIQGISTTPQGVEIDFAAQLVGIDKTKIDQIEIIASQPFGNQQTFSGQLAIDVNGFIAPIDLPVQGAVAPTATSNFNGNLVADIAGGSAAGTDLTGETTNTVIWKYHTSGATNEAFSAAIFRRPNFVNSGKVDANGQPIFIPEPFDVSGLGSIRLNFDQNGLSGQPPQNFTVSMVDANGVRQDFLVKNFTGASASIDIAINPNSFPSGFLFNQVTEITLVSVQTFGDMAPHDGQLRVTVQGVAFTFQTNAGGQVGLAQTTDWTNSASPSTAFLGEIGGGTAETSTQFVAVPTGSTQPADRFTDINYSVNVGNYSGYELNAGFDAQGNARLMNLSQAQIPSQTLVMGIEFLAGATLPDRTIVEIVDVNNRRYRTRVDGLQVGTKQSISIPLLPVGTPGSKLPAGFDLAQVRSVNLVFEGPFVNSGGQTAKSGTARVQMQGYSSLTQVSVGTAFNNGQITDFSNVSSTQNARISVAAGSSALTAITQSGNQFTLRMVTSGTSPNSGFILQPLTPGGRFNLSNTNVNINVARSTTEVPQQFFARFVDNAGGFVDVPLSAGVLNLNVGETIFTNSQSLPTNQVSAANIVRIEISALQISGDAATHDATIVLTLNGVVAQSLGATALAPVKPVRPATIVFAPAPQPGYDIVFTDEAKATARISLTAQVFEGLVTASEHVDSSSTGTLEDLLLGKLTQAPDLKIDSSKIVKIDIIPASPEARQFPDAFKISPKTRYAEVESLKNQLLKENVDVNVPIRFINVARKVGSDDQQIAKVIAAFMERAGNQEAKQKFVVYLAENERDLMTIVHHQQTIARTLQQQTPTRGTGLSLGAARVAVQQNEELITETARIVSTRIAPENLERRFLGEPAATITSFTSGLIDRFVVEVQAAEPTTRELTLTEAAKAQFARLAQVNPALAKINQAIGGKIDILGERVPNKSDQVGTVLAMGLNPNVQFRDAYFGEEVDRIKAVEKAIQQSKDLYGREIGERFKIKIINPKDSRILRHELETMAVEIYNHTPGVKSSMKLGEFKEHVVWVGSAATLDLVDVAYHKSVRITDDIQASSPTRNSDEALLQIVSARVAALTFAGVSPEDKATYKLNSKEVRATNLVENLSKAFETFWQAEIAVAASA